MLLNLNKKGKLYTFSARYIKMKVCFAGIFLTVLSCVGAVDLPCAARDGAPGHSKICVCNSTYCDTIERPVQLDKTQFHYYKTSNSSPGFTHTILDFTQVRPFAPNDDEIIYTIDPSETFQTYEGLGGSATDSSGIQFTNLSPGTQDNFLKSYFSPSGIEYSFMRIPMGSTDFGERSYSLDDVPFDDDLSHFSLVNEDYIYRISMIKKAMSLSERHIKLSACPWASPQWMRVRQSSSGDFITEEYLATWARYYVKFLEAYRENGLELWSVSPGNEPFLLYLVPQQLLPLNGTMYTADSQAKWLKTHLKPQLVAANFTDVKLLGLEDQTVFLFYWMDAFRVDPEAYAVLDGLGLHWYNDWFVPDTLYKALADLIHKNYPDKIMFYTEGSINGAFDGDPVVLGSWERAEAFIYRLFMILDNWNVGFMDWNLVLDPEGGPTRTFNIECTMIANTTSDEFYKQPIFYGIGHYSKFIQPGSVKVRVKSNQNNTDNQNISVDSILEDLRLWNSKRKVDSIIPFITIPENVGSLAVANPDNSFTVIVINTKNVTVLVRVVDSRVGSIVMDIEEHSINSFVYWP